MDKVRDDPRRRRRRHQLRADAARAADQRRPRARGRTSASTSTRSPTTCARWSAARRCRSSRTATISSRCCCASTSRTGQPGDDGRPARRRPAPGKTVKVSDVAHAEERLRPGVDRPLQPAAPDFGERQPAGRAARRGARRGARQGRGAAPEAGLSGGVRRQRADAGRGVEQLRRSRSCSPSSSSTWCWRRSSTASSTR